MSRTRTMWLGLAAAAVLGVAGGGIGVYALVTPADKLLGPWNATDDGVAISGYDTVAYHTVGEAVVGQQSFAHNWQDATWLFSTPEHRDLFAEDPEAYAPQFGGFCSAAMTYGTAAKADPTVWAVVDGKLYLNYDDYAQELFYENLADNIAKAEDKWAEKVEEFETEQAREAKLKDALTH